MIVWGPEGLYRAVVGKRRRAHGRPACSKKRPDIFVITKTEDRGKDIVTNVSEKATYNANTSYPCRVHSSDISFAHILYVHEHVHTQGRGRDLREEKINCTVFFKL